MRRWHKDPYCETLPEKEQWTLKLLTGYVEKKLRVLSGEKSYFGISVSTDDIVSDKRRAPTIRKHLESLGLVVPSLNGADLKVIESAAEALLPTYEKFPVLDASGYVEKKIADNLITCYVDIDMLSYREIIYVYRHQDEFNIRKVVYNHASSGHSSSRTKVFSVALLDTLKNNILKIQAESYTKYHLPQILKGIYGWKSKAIHSDDPFEEPEDYVKVACFDGEDITEETLTDRIVQAAKQARLLRRACKEMLRLRKTLRESPNHEADLYTNAQQFLLEQAPLWINMTEEELYYSDNKNRKRLAEMYLKGEPPMYPS